MSPAPFIWQFSKDLKIRCLNNNNISEKFNGKTWLTKLWYSEGVAVFDNKGKLVISIRMVIGWVVLLMCKKNYKMNKRELNLSISTPSVNNVNVSSIRVTIGWVVFLMCKKNKK